MTLLLGNSKHSGEQSGTPTGLSVWLKPEHMVSTVTISVYIDDDGGRAALEIVIIFSCHYMMYPCRCSVHMRQHELWLIVCSDIHHLGLNQSGLNCPLTVAPVFEYRRKQRTSDQSRNWKPCMKYCHTLCIFLVNMEGITPMLLNVGLQEVEAVMIFNANGGI